jgi:hypothetical protein
LIIFLETRCSAPFEARTVFENIPACCRKGGAFHAAQRPICIAKSRAAKAALQSGYASMCDFAAEKQRTQTGLLPCDSSHNELQLLLFILKAVLGALGAWSTFNT